MGVIIVAGVPAAGKSTITRLVTEKSGRALRVINFGDEMYRLAKRRRLVKGKEDLKNQPTAVQEEIQKAVARRIMEKTNRQDVLIETDCSIKTPAGYLPGLPGWILEKLNPSMIILLEADPDEILVRRAMHPDKFEVEYVATIDEHQRMNRVLALTYAIFTGATVKIIKNHDGLLDKAIKEMEDSLG
ncbi:MAG: adenylate kinase [Candidatus Hydrothermarchaeota archaeon]